MWTTTIQEALQICPINRELKGLCSPQNTFHIFKNFSKLIDEDFQIDPDKVNGVIGSGGKTVRSIIEYSGVDSIDLEDDGSVSYCIVAEYSLIVFVVWNL